MDLFNEFCGEVNAWIPTHRSGDPASPKTFPSGTDTTAPAISGFHVRNRP